MERILKKQANTVHNSLHNYSLQIFSFFCLLAIAGIGASAITARATKQENKWLFEVNSFYTGLQEENTLLYSSVTGQAPQSYTRILSNGQFLMETLWRMEQYPVSRAYKREIQDLTGIMENYIGRLNTIHQLMMDGQSYAELSDIWSEMRNLYQEMDDTFQTIFVQISDACTRLDVRAGKLRTAYLLLLIVTVLLLLVYMILQARQIEQSITAPIQQLEDELVRTDILSFENAAPLTCSPVSCDDVRLLVQVYNSMLQKINVQLKEREEYHNTRVRLQEQEVLNLKISNDLKKAQLANLQSQINPHFLFNTLNMISQTAYMEEDRSTVTLLDMTSDLLRYALDYSDKAVPLSKEIEILGKYVYLQEQRFGDRIRFLFDLDESFHKIQVPNLILQPLVENAIIHGISMFRSEAEIMIRTKYHPDQDMGQISVIDNGIGMEAAVLAQVEENMRSGTIVTGKDGLSNVYLRLSLFFNREAKMMIYSAPGQGTEIAIYVPCHGQTVYL